jgi:hypothetical protein
VWESLTDTQKENHSIFESLFWPKLTTDLGKLTGSMKEEKIFNNTKNWKRKTVNNFLQKDFLLVPRNKE